MKQRTLAFGFKVMPFEMCIAATKLLLLFAVGVTLSQVSLQPES